MLEDTAVLHCVPNYATDSYGGSDSSGVRSAAVTADLKADMFVAVAVAAVSTFVVADMDMNSSVVEKVSRRDRIDGSVDGTVGFASDKLED